LLITSLLTLQSLTDSRLLDVQTLTAAVTVRF